MLLTLHSLLFFTYVHVTHSTCETQLLLVDAMFRHGERTPELRQMQQFPKYEQMNNTFEPYGLGELTQKGKETMYKLGQKLKERYAPLLYNKTELTQNEVKMESTKYNRSLVSAQLVLDGLLGKEKNSSLQKDWKEENKEELAKKYLNAEKERLLKFYYSQKCLTYLIEVVISLNRTENQIKFLECENPMQLMVALLGVKRVPTPLNVWGMFEVFKAQNNTNVALPNWVTEDLFKEMEYCIVAFLKFAFGSDKFKQRSGGIYVELIMNEFQAVVNKRDKEKDKKIRLFSGHDSTVASAVAALGGIYGYTKNGTDFTVDIPTYGATIITELHKVINTGRYFIKVLYWNGNLDQEPMELKIQGCGNVCFLKEYSTLIEKIRITKNKLEKCQKIGII